MASASKLVPMRPKLATVGSPLTPELKEFIDRVIAPNLVVPPYRSLKRTARAQESPGSFPHPD